MTGRGIRTIGRWLGVCAVVALLAAGAPAAIPEAERQALIDLYLATGGDTWTHNDNWRLPGDPGQFNLPGTENTWYGVTTDDENTTVRELIFNWNGLSGQLPESLGDLTQLATLSLTLNSFSGSIPETLGNLSNLKTLNLRNNLLSGSIPESLGDLSALEILCLSHNQLSGAIPESLGNLSHLKELDLQWNRLINGSIPESLGNLVSLEVLSLGLNQLSGSIPATLGNLSRLQVLSLYGNKLSGEIPPELSILAELRMLTLRNNQLSGPIPSSLGDLSRLETLELSSNSFSGSIPDSLRNLTNLRNLALGSWTMDGTLPAFLGDLSQLTSLNISKTSISGSIPPELGRLTLLKTLDLHWSALSGDIPAELGGLTALTSLNLSMNQFTGPLPETFGDLASLTSLDLSENQLNGPIPASWAGLTALRYLSLYRNQLSGPLPVWLGELSELRSLNLWVNEFTGPIPESLSNLSQLMTLQLHGNLLSGSIPASLGSLSALRTLNLGWNALDGAIPESLGSLAELDYLNLSYCSLSGPIPESLGNLSHLRELYLYENHLSGSVPPSFSNLSELQKLSLAGNQLGGHLPEYLGDLASLEYLNLGNNLFHGTIPETWGALPALQGLYLEGNQLGGPIPEYLGSMTSLTFLDLSKNQFSGTIPAALGDLSQLQGLYLAWNELSGTIPAALGDLTCLSALDLEGNRLSGAIPDFFDAMPMLGSIDLSMNQFSGEIPPSIGSLDNLYWLMIDSNHLTGTIPSTLTDMATLLYMSFRDNQLSGSVPPTLMNMPRLDVLRLDYNALHGDTPELEEFLDRLGYPWPEYGYKYRSYQTLPPTALVVAELQPGAVRLTWTPDPPIGENYSGAGGYEVWHREKPGAVWRLRGVIPDKAVTTWTGSVIPGQTNAFRLRTFTPPQYWRVNRVASEFTPQRSVSPPGGGQTVNVYVQEDRTGGIYIDSPSQVAPSAPITVRIDPAAFAAAGTGPHILWITLPPYVTLSQTLATGNPDSAAPLPLAGERVTDLAVVEYRFGDDGRPEPVEGSQLTGIGPHAVQLLRYVAGENAVLVRIVESTSGWYPQHGGTFLGFTIGLATGSWPTTGASNWGPGGMGAQASSLVCVDLRQAGFDAGDAFRVTLYATQQPGAQLLPLIFAGGGYALFTVAEVLTGAIPVTTALGTPIEDFDTGDVDGDGVDDLVAVTPGERRVYWSQGSRTGGFFGIDWAELQEIPVRVDVADVDGDARPDVLTADEAGTLHVYLWASLFGPDKAGAGRAVPDRAVRLAGLVTDARVCDVTGDGCSDYVFCDAGGDRLHVLAGPVFSGGNSYFTEQEPVALAAGDFNGDTWPDLAVANAASNSVSVLWNDGGGHFTAKVLAGVGNRPVDLDAGDIDRDGLEDLVVVLAADKAVGILRAVSGNAFDTAGQQKIFFQRTPSAVLADNFDGAAGADALVGFADSARLALCTSDDAGVLQHSFSIDTLGDVVVDSVGRTTTLAADQVLSVAGGTTLGGIASREGVAVVASRGVNLVHFPRSAALSFSVVNLGAADTLANLELYADSGGTLLATATDVIPAGAQYARYLSGVLGQAAEEPGRWVRAFLTEPDTHGIWLVNDAALTYLDGTRMPEARDAQGRLLFPVVHTGGDRTTTLVLINPLRLPTRLNFTVYGPAGAVKATRSAVLDGRGRLELDVANHFAGIAAGDSIEVESERGIFGLELFGDAGAVACLEAMTSEADGGVLYAPHVAIGDLGVPYASILTLVNMSDAPLNVDLSLYTDQGQPVAGSPVTRSLSAHGKFEADVAALFDMHAAFTGYLAADPGDAIGLAGCITFGEAGAGGRFLSSMPLAPRRHNRFLMGHIANGRIGNVDYFTGLAVLHPDSENAARIQITAFDSQGLFLDSRQLVLQPYHESECPECVLRRVFLLDGFMPDLTAIFGGYLLVENQSSSAGVLVFELFGDYGLNVLSAVPAVPVEE